MKKALPNPGLVVLSILSQSPFKHTRFQAETRTKTSGVVTSTKSGLLTLILYTWTPRGFGLVPKRNLWFPGCWENLYLKVNLFFLLHGMHTCMFALKKIFIHILRFVECSVTAVYNGGNCYTLFWNHSNLGEIESVELFIEVFHVIKFDVDSWQTANIKFQNVHSDKRIYSEWNFLTNVKFTFKINFGFDGICVFSSKRVVPFTLP